MDELQISGKRFISSRRLAREHGYTADYLGQLIRGGKVVGQKVGRAWYVDAASFDAYLGGEELVQPVQPEQQVQVTPEEPAQEIKTIIEAPAPVVVKEQKIKIEEKIEEPIVAAPAPVTVIEEVQHVPLRVVKAEAPAGLRYYADTEPSLPEIRLNRSESRIAEPAYAPAAGEKEVFVAPQVRRSSKLPAIAFAGAALAVFIFSAVLSSAVSLNLNIEAGNTAATSYSLGW